MLHRYRRRPGSFGRPSRSSFASIRIDGRNEEFGLVVRRRVHVPQKVLDGKRPRMHYYRLRTNFPKRLILVVHRGPLRTVYRIRETWIPRAASLSYWQRVARAPHYSSSIPSFFPTCRNTSSAVSSSAFVCVDATIVRTRALPLATVGKPMPVASTPPANSSRDSWCASAASPTITGVIGVSLIPVLNPADFSPALK